MLGVEKHSLKFKHEKNGLFLKIHHTIESEDGKHKIRFKLVDICSSNDMLAAVDETENLFIFDLRDKCFWQLTEVSIANISTIKFVPPHFNVKRKQQKSTQDAALAGHGRSSNLLIGNKSGFIYEIEIITCKILRCIRGFSSEINQLLCSSMSSGNCSKTFLASTTNQIKIYEHDKFTRKSEFSFRNEIRIKFVKWMPHDEKILAILTNDTICIFGDGCLLKPIRHYEPVKARDKFLRKSNHRIELLKYVGDGDNAEDGHDMKYLASSELEPSAVPVAHDTIKNDRIIKSVTRDYQNGIIADISFHWNGCNGASSAVIALMDNTIIQISTTMWDVRRVIAFPDFFLKQCQFIPHLEGVNVLLTRTSNDELMLTCMNDLNSRMLIDMNNLNSFVLSSNGRLLVNMQQSGELLVYNLENHLNDLMIIKGIVMDGKRRNNGGVSVVNGTVVVDDERAQQKMNKEKLLEIQMKMTKTMPRARLLPILREFCEYPDKYRVMMWKTLLKLPENCDSFATLLKRDLISGVSNYDKRFSLVDHKALSNLKQIMSCIVHWTPVFENVRYLPKFVFPFVKMSKGDLLFTFELVVTLLHNHCQLWFEFLPLVDVPYNYLNIVENVLMKMDKKLYEFYKSKGITSQQYALPLMESAFSEVLDQSLWLQLWDHIVTFEPFHLVFIIVAFNSILRTNIMRCDDVESITRIFYEQNFINLKHLMKKAQGYMKKCPTGIHPSHYMTTFMPLASSSDGYRKFENYQRNLINSKNVSEIDALKSEQKILDQKLVELESFERSMEAKLESCLIDEEYAKRLEEVEAKFEQAVEEEEQRIIYQRKLLLLNMKKVREKEIETIIRMKNASLRNSVERGERDLDTMLRAIEKQRQREEIEMQMADESLKLKEVLLELKAFSGTPNASGSHHVPLAKKYESMLTKLGEQHKKFMDELGQIEQSTTPGIILKESSGLTSETTSMATSTTASSLKTFPPSQQSQDIEGMERAFHALRKEYDQCVGKADNKMDYKQHMKKLEREMEKLEGEINSILSEMKIPGN